MQGTWKEQVSGYDRKGSRRKKHTRKHTLKDKVKPLIRKFHYNEEYNDSIRVESAVEITKPETKYLGGAWIETWRIETQRYTSQHVYDDYLMSEHSYSVRTAYKAIDGCWYDEYTDEQISGRGISINPISFLYKEEVTFDEPIPIKEYYYLRADSNETVFIYGKPLNVKFYHGYGFWSSRRRKFAQKFANRKDRSRLKDWFNKGDFDIEIKTHCTSKSIDWDVW